jgi:nucleoside diphosphate kinase
MRAIILTLLIPFTMMMSGCNTLRYVLNEGDAVSAIREMLTIGAGMKSIINKQSLIEAVLPGEVGKVLQTVQQLGLSKEVDKFTNTLTTAATESAEQSIPVFLLGIKKMNIRDAVSIVKNGGTGATDYLRRTIGDSLRSAITPVMRTALNKYNVMQAWDDMIGPAKPILGEKGKLNLNIDNLLAAAVTLAMFKKIEEQEIAIRTKAEARSTQLLQKVFGRDWSKPL